MIALKTGCDNLCQLAETALSLAAENNLSGPAGGGQAISTISVMATSISKSRCTVERALLAVMSKLSRTN